MSLRSFAPGAEVERRLWWLRLLLGVVATGLGVAALVWPVATVRVVGALFGLNLLITGLVRAATSLLAVGFPVLYRVIAVVFGVLTAVVGIVCLRNVLASAVLLVLFVGIGWLLDGIVEIALGLAGEQDPLRGWRIGAGVAYVVAAIVVLVWPKLGLATFVTFGAVILIAVGVAHLAAAVALLRTRPGGHPAAVAGA